MSAKVSMNNLNGVSKKIQRLNYRGKLVGHTAKRSRTHTRSKAGKKMRSSLLYLAVVLVTACTGLPEKLKLHWIFQWFKPYSAVSGF